jgi:hypothetical protein
MWHMLTFVLPACGLGVAMLLLLEAGRRIGIWRGRKNRTERTKKAERWMRPSLDSWAYRLHIFAASECASTGGVKPGSTLNNA